MAKQPPGVAEALIPSPAPQNVHKSHHPNFIYSSEDKSNPGGRGHDLKENPVLSSLDAFWGFRNYHNNPSSCERAQSSKVRRDAPICGVWGTLRAPPAGTCLFLRKRAQHRRGSCVEPRAPGLSRVGTHVCLVLPTGPEQSTARSSRVTATPPNASPLTTCASHGITAKNADLRSHP